MDTLAASVRRSILIVDDNEDARESLGKILEMYGHEVRCARDGLSALEIVKGFQPELVLLDIGLPIMDGYEVIARLRADSGARKIAFAAMTGYGQPEDRRRTREAGFDHHLIKPVNIENLLAIIATPDTRPPHQRG